MVLTPYLESSKDLTGAAKEGQEALDSEADEAEGDSFLKTYQPGRSQD